jgi:hypothetical protein
MGEAASQLGRRAVAVAILVAVAWVFLKLLIGALTAFAWLAVVVLALVAVVWAVWTL